MFDKCYSSSPLDTSGNYIGDIVTVLPSSLWMKAAEMMNVYLLSAYIWEPRRRGRVHSKKRGEKETPREQSKNSSSSGSHPEEPEEPTLKESQINIR